MTDVEDRWRTDVEDRCVGQWDQHLVVMETQRLYMSSNRSCYLKLIKEKGTTEVLVLTLLQELLILLQELLNY